MIKQRYWLSLDGNLCKRPLIWELSRNFDLIFNIRNASITGEIGIIGIELEGNPEVIKEAVSWLESQGVHVEPVEISTIEG
ncbi:NIL domain-containing protein [Methylacidiphilum sp. Yel]|jgi:ABC-type methionine transport system ATPase subunit|uniref:NIL domain-containing protein n=1 Tax=Methylacidiphilum sp. Yel TaxID=1847730 RepID=UPI00106D2561|nr:NIL domain-containing protein [Methylacidiphilum sp. Yel]